MRLGVDAWNHLEIRTTQTPLPPQTTPTAMLVETSPMDSVVRTALPVAGLGLQATLSNGTPRTLTVDAKLRDQIPAHRRPMTIPMEMPVIISLTENVAQIATLAPGLGQQMTLSSGAQPTLLVGARKVARMEGLMTTQMMKTALLQTLMIQPTSMSGAMPASPILTMIVQM